MNRSKIIILLLSLCSLTSIAQPRYSPGVRAQRETQWILDSLHISPDKGDRIHTISLNYYQQMDKASELPGKEKDKKQKHLMNKKDADMRALMNKEQYQRYYKREEGIRQREKIIYKGPHQPL